MKKESKKAKSLMKAIKLTTIILLIVLISMIGFFGIYKQDKNQMSNIIKDYTYAMDINGARNVRLVVDTENEEEKTVENYKKAQKIIEKRLKDAGVQEYNINLNETTGAITIEMPENTDTDSKVSNLNTTGKFEIKDESTDEVLLNNDDIKSSEVLYNTTSNGTAVYLSIDFNKERKNKLEEISKKYTHSHDEETNEATSNETETETNETTENSTEENSEETKNENKIKMEIDGQQIMSTSFEEPITNGKIQLSVGTASTDTKTIQGYFTQAQNVATVLDNGNLPVKYNVEKNQYILSNITEENLKCVAVAGCIVALIGIVILTIVFKTNGLVAGISEIGLAAIYLIVLRYTNVMISIESIVGIALILVLNYIFTFMILNNIKKMKKENAEKLVNKATTNAYIKFFNRSLPICIMAIAFSFAKWIPLSSFGMVTVWGLVTIAIYNAIITKSILKIKEENK